MTHRISGAGSRRIRIGRKAWLAAMLAIGLMVLSACSSGGTTDSKAFSYTVNPDQTASITGIDGNIKQVIIPEEIDGHRVAGIAEGAFSKNQNLEKVTIPDTVISIGSKAFRNCKNLVTVVMPKEIEEMGEQVFAWCEYLENINLPANLRAIPYQTFLHCESLEGLSIPDTVETIGEGAFSYCKELKKIELPDGIVSLGEECFNACEVLADVRLPANLTVIPKRAFNGCSKLQDLALPSSVSLIEDQAFSGCHLLGTFTIPDTVLHLTGNPFTTCQKIELSEDHPSLCLKDGVLLSREGALIWYPFQSTLGDEYRIPDGVTVINSHAFFFSNARKVILPNTVHTIESSAFGTYRTLEEVVVPASVTLIGDLAIDSKTTMIVERGSYAEEWALSKDRPLSYASE